MRPHFFSYKRSTSPANMGSRREKPISEMVFKGLGIGEFYCPIVVDIDQIWKTKQFSFSEVLHFLS